MENSIKINIEQAKELYKSNNAVLKEIALQAFSEVALIGIGDFRNITTFKKACEALDLDYNAISFTVETIAKISKASAAMFKVNIIRKALNLGQDLHLTKSPKNSLIHYPHNPFVTEKSTYYESKINSGKMEVIGKIKSEGTIYTVLSSGDSNGGGGLGNFCISGYNEDEVGYAYASFGFLGCASKEIAQHFGKYFGMLITEAKYGDMVDFEIIDGEKE